MALPTTFKAESESSQKNKYLLPLILVTSLFFLWGMAYGLLDVLNKHFQETLNITTARSTLLQAAYFGAYFLIALPAGLFITRFGYKRGIILGLLLYALGSFLFYPAAQNASFNFFLIALFILAAGLTCLETAANPYITVLGKPETSALRLNLAQCFNGVGSFLGPVIGANLFFSENNLDNLDSVQMVYLIIGVVVILIAALFMRTPLPEIVESKLVSSKILDQKPLFSHSNFTGAIIAQFFYVAAQVGIAALFINYCTAPGNNINNSKAAYLLGVAMVLFTIGRFVGTGLMKFISPNKLLTLFALVNIALSVIVILGFGMISIYALMVIFFFESIMFPTIFALGIKDLGHHTKKASSFIIMAIVGGALVPVVMGFLTDHYSIHTAYIVPLLCFVVVAWYGITGYKVKIPADPIQ
ncbi:MAG: sugar MFS transporter [Ginsengibacter sp.]